MVNSEQVSDVVDESLESSDNDDSTESVSTDEVRPSEMVRTLSSESSGETTAVRTSCRGGPSTGKESYPEKDKHKSTL